MSWAIPAGEPWQWGVVEAAAAVRNGAVAPSELVESVLRRIEAVEPDLHAFTHVDRAGAEAQAEALTREAADGAWRGPLHGVPVAIKDIFDVAGLPTRCGSRLFDDAPPAAVDAEAVARLRSAGAVVVGKTATHELACGVYTEPARNPWDLERCCGGSSGGSAAAVAAGAAAAATGSDTGGSIRIPAALCGIVGVKPTYGLVSRRGVAALSWSLDHVGPLARSVEDAAAVLEAMAGVELRPLPDLDLAAVRLGVPDTPVLTRVQPEVRARFEEACAALAAAGAAVVDVPLPELEETLPVEFAIVMAEAASYHARAVRERSELIGAGIRELLRSGALLPAEDYLAAQRLRAAIRAAVARAFADHELDALLTPTLPLPAYAPTDERVVIEGVEEPVIEAAVRTTAPFNLTGLPVVSVPSGLAGGRLPVALQLVGRPRGERRLLALARAYERLRETPDLDAARPVGRETLRPRDAAVPRT